MGQQVRLRHGALRRTFCVGWLSIGQPPVQLARFQGRHMLFPVVAGVSVRLSRCCHPLRPQPSRACSALAAGRAGSCCSQRRAPASSRSPCLSVSCAVAAAEAKGAASWCDASQRAACFAGGPVHAGSLPPLSLTNQFTSAVSSADLVLRFGRPLRPDQIPGGPKAAAATTAAATTAAAASIIPCITSGAATRRRCCCRR